MSDKYIIDNLDIRKINQPIIHKECKGYEVASKKLNYLIENNINKNKFVKPENLLIITISTYDEETILEKSLKHLGINDYVVLNEKFEGKWNFIFKIEWLLKYLNKNNIKEKYLLFLDSRDAILQNDPKEILRNFFDYNCKVLFGATEYDYDFFKKHKQFAHDDVKKIVIKNKNENFGRNLYNYYINRHNKNKLFLNSGTVIGEVEYIKKFLSFIINNTPKKIAYDFNCDQSLISNYVPLFQDIKIDIYFKIFWRDTFRNNHHLCWNPRHKPPY